MQPNPDTLEWAALIEKEEKKIQELKYNYERLNVIYNIIEVKRNSGKVLFKRQIYIDLKRLIEYYVLSIEESFHGYYEINQESLFSKISYVSIDEQITLLKFLQRKLKLAGYDDHDEYDEKIIDLRLKKYWQELNLKNIIKSFVLLSTKNLLWLIISLIVLYAFYFVLLLPAPFPFMESIKIEYEALDDHFAMNHFLNTLISYCNLESSLSIKALNVLGILSILMIKGFVLVIILNYLLSEIKKKIKFQ